MQSIPLGEPHVTRRAISLRAALVKKQHTVSTESHLRASLDGSSELGFLRVLGSCGRGDSWHPQPHINQRGFTTYILYASILMGLGLGNGFCCRKRRKRGKKKVPRQGLGLQVSGRVLA